jgi:hypothetical protein
LRNITYSGKTELRRERPVFLPLQVADLGIAVVAERFASLRFALRKPRASQRRHQRASQRRNPSRFATLGPAVR